ncbi:hypothetical protein B0T19DRAFT_362247, partial [Cercophora scortea]
PSEEPGKSVKSLWQEAFDALQAAEPERIEKYKDRLALVVGDDTIPPDSPEGLQILSRKGLEQMEEKRKKFTVLIAGGAISLTGFITGTVELIELSKGLINSAVEGVPPANFVWAGICLVLPLLTNPIAAKKANETGFTYVTSQIEFYLALESLILSSTAGYAAQKPLRDSVLELYRLVIDFQIQSVLYFSRPSVSNLARDMVRYDDWEGMLSTIKEQEDEVIKRADKIISAGSYEKLHKVHQESLRTTKTMQSLLKVAEEHLEVAKENLQVMKSIQASLTPDEEKCLRLLRVSDYKFYKDRIKERVQGTCLWCLDNQKYQEWLGSASGVLLVSADPGCGKSVLAKYLVEEGLPESATVCYFFFKDADQNTLKQALCALLHQLFQRMPHLIKHAMGAFRSNGDKLTETTSALWEILINSLSDPGAGPIIFVLDALDECQEQEMKSLADMLEAWFRTSNRRGGAPSNLKFLLTARPYERVTGAIQQLEDYFPTIRIKGENEWKCLGEEINAVIHHRIDELFKGKPPAVQERLRKRMLAIPHRTYLWMHLVFDFLQSHLFKATPKGVDEIIAILPNTVHDAYARILDKCQPDAHVQVRKTLLSVVGAYRPLTVRELQIIFELNSHSESPPEPDLESDEEFKNRIREYCGLFISIHDNKVFLIHQTAKEFLLNSQAVSWLLPFDAVQADISMAETCIAFLNIPGLNEDLDNFHRDFSGPGHMYSRGMSKFHIQEALSQKPFRDYATTFWHQHSREIAEMHNSVRAGYQNLLDCSQPFTQIWLRYGLEVLHSHRFEGNSIVAALLEPDEEIVSLLLGYGLGLNTKSLDGNTPLHYLVRGHRTSARLINLLLDRGADPNSVDRDGRTPLHTEMSTDICALLVDAGSQVNQQDNFGQSPLFYHDSDGIKYLLSRGADPSVVSTSGKTALHYAACDEEVRTLVDAGLKVDATDGSGSTPLHTCLANDACAALLELGGSVHARDKSGRTPLMRFETDFPALKTPPYYQNKAKELLAAGADPNARCHLDSKTPLHYLCTGRSLLEFDDIEECVKSLISAGAHIDAKDGKGNTPLLLLMRRPWQTPDGQLLDKMEYGIQEEIAELLVQAGADIDLPSGEDGRTPRQLLSEAARSCETSPSHKGCVIVHFPVLRSIFGVEDLGDV